MPASPPLPAIAPELLALAPLDLPNFRTVRYAGDDVCIAVASLAERDQTLVRRLYDHLTELLYVITDKSIDDPQRWEGIENWLRRHELDLLVDEVRELGEASHARHPDDELAKAMHDIRGGALSALIGRLALRTFSPRDEAHLKVLFVLVRDHLKIMRSAMVGLDEARRKSDRKRRLHSMSLMIEKWHQSIVGPKWQERPIRMYVDCRYEGGLTECCLESAAIDRIFYNVANNACRHVQGDCLDLAVFPIPEPASDCLRFVLSNPVNASDADYLRSLMTEGGDLFALFEPQVSSTGSGFGLTVVADFVAGAFGLTDRSEALRNGYVGAVLDGDTFRVWFHWMAARSDLPAKVDDYHQPDQSLSEA